MFQLGLAADLNAARSLLPMDMPKFVIGLPPHPDSLITNEDQVAKLVHNQDPVVVEWNPSDAILIVCLIISFIV